MARNRRNRLITVLFALVSLLFMQLAVASYACPGMSSKVTATSEMAEAGMPCAQSMTATMDEEQPNLCQAHCQAGQQVADKTQLPAPVAITALPPDFTLPVIALVYQGAPLQAPHLVRTTAPPVSIRHCCFRL
jgi:hypothetical protein